MVQCTTHKLKYSTEESQSLRKDWAFSFICILRIKEMRKVNESMHI